MNDAMDARPRPHGPRLALEWSDDQGAVRHELPADRALVVGRDPRCDVVFDDRAVSRRHCAFVPGDGAWYLRPISKRSPTRLNGRLVVRDTEVSPGDEVQLAMMAMRVVVRT